MYSFFKQKKGGSSAAYVHISINEERVIDLLSFTGKKKIQKEKKEAILSSVNWY